MLITYPLNNIEYMAEDAELFHCTRTSGIWAEDSFALTVTGTDNQVTVGKGVAWINNEEFAGKITAMKTAETLDLGIADSVYPRIDVIALQFNANKNATELVVKKGTPATNPIRPEISKTAAVYELYLASVFRPAGATAVTAANVTDLRMDQTVCGLMADSVTRVDMDAIYAQLMDLVGALEEAIRNIEVNGINPIEKGGTGADNAEEALLNLGAISLTKVWENAKPTTSFPAQSISTDLAGYDMVMVEAILYSNGDYADKLLSPVFSEIGKDGYLVGIGGKDGYFSGVIYVGARTFEVSETGISFDGGRSANTSGGSGSWLTTAATCIPQRIYGIKGVK